MIKIGDFARLSHVSIVTLRHYDEIGLLTPISVDNVSGYRYYSVAQLPRLHRIVALKDLGFSLDQIDRVLRDRLTVDQLHGMLMMKQAEVERHVAEERGRLARIAARLRQIEREDGRAVYDIVLKTVSPLLIAVRRVTIPTNDVASAYLIAAFTEASAHVRTHGAKERGPRFAVWHQPAAIHTNEEANAAVPIDRRIPSTDHVQICELPQVQVASAVHQGDFTDFTREHTALLTWIGANGYSIVGPYREIYMNYDRSNMSESATEIQYPIDKAV